MFNLSGVGNLTADPIIREVGSTTVSKFTVATNRTIKRGETKESVGTFLMCEAWGSINKIIENWKKGDKIQFSGELEQQNWEKDGEKRSALVCRVDKVKGVNTKDKAVAEAGGAESSDSAGGDEVPF